MCVSSYIYVRNTHIRTFSLTKERPSVERERESRSERSIEKEDMRRLRREARRRATRTQRALLLRFKRSASLMYVLCLVYVWFVIPSYVGGLRVFLFGVILAVGAAMVYAAENRGEGESERKKGVRVDDGDDEETIPEHDVEFSVLALLLLIAASLFVSRAMREDASGRSALLADDVFLETPPHATPSLRGQNPPR